MSAMFNSAQGNSNGNVSTWNTANVTDMSYLFQNNNVFNSDISGWNTGNVTTMLQMFNGRSSLTPTLRTGMSSKSRTCSRCSSMHGHSTKISVGGTSFALLDTSRMFESAVAMNSPLDGWGAKTSSVTRMNRMFYQSHVVQPAAQFWNVGNVTTFGEMFAGATVFNKDELVEHRQGHRHVQHVLERKPLSMETSLRGTPPGHDLRELCAGAAAFNKDIGAWNTTSATTMAQHVQERNRVQPGPCARGTWAV